MRSWLSTITLAAFAALAAGEGRAQDAPQAQAAGAPDQSVTVFPASYFAAQNANTAWDMISRVPGFTFDPGDQVRGFAGSAGNVLIDGERPTAKNDPLQDMLRRMPSGQVDRIELIRGGAPGIDMHGKTVVVNVVRKTTGGFQGVVVVASGLESGYALPQSRLVGTWRRGAVEADANLLVSQYLDTSAGLTGPHTIRDAAGDVENRSQMHNLADGVQATGTGTLQAPLLGGTFRANLMAQDVTYRARLHDDFSDAFVFSGDQDEHDVQDQTDGELGLHYDHPLGAGNALELIGLQHLSRRNFDSRFVDDVETDRFRLDDTGGESIARAVLHDTLSPSLSLEDGGEFDYNWVRTRTTFTQNGVPITVPAANDEVTEKRGEVFATATWRPLPKLTLEAGARVEASEIASTGDVVLANRFVFLKPRLLLTWAATGADQVRLRLEREVGQLDFGNFTASSTLNSGGSTVLTGNPNLTPQQDWVAELAWEHHFGKAGVISLTARRLALRDVIDRVPDPTGQFDAPGNIGSGQETDLIATFTLPLGLIIPGGELRGTETWRQSKVTDPTTGMARAISGQHPVDAAELHFAQDLPAAKATWGIDAYPPWREEDYRFNEIDTTRFIGPWVTLYVEYKPRPDLSVRLLIDDVLNQPLDLSRTVFDGPRSSNPAPAFVDDQYRRSGRIFYIRVRKTFS